jgi:flagellar basal body-associated protein FliL
MATMYQPPPMQMVQPLQMSTTPDSIPPSNNKSAIIIGLLGVLVVGLCAIIIWLALELKKKPAKTACPTCEDCPTCKDCPVCPSTPVIKPATTMQSDANYDRVTTQFQTYGTFVTSAGDEMNNTAIVMVGEFMKANNISGYSLYTNPANLYMIITAPSTQAAINLIKILLKK